MSSAIQLPAGSTATANDKETLKLWLCELTHLTPQQVENLMEQMEQQQPQSSP